MRTRCFTNAGDRLRPLIVEQLRAACGHLRPRRIVLKPNWVLHESDPAFPIRALVTDARGADRGGPCRCGCAWPRLASVDGRSDEMLLTEDGTLLSSVFVRHFVGVSLNRQAIREWQLEQTGRGEFVFRYVPARREGLEDNLARLRERFLLALGRSASIEMIEVPAVPPSASGKTRWIINRVAPAPVSKR